MSDQQRTEGGYRGALPPRNDRLAGPWVMIVIVAFVAMFVLAFFGLPSGLIPEETPGPVPSIPLPSTSPSGAAPS